MTFGQTDIRPTERSRGQSSCTQLSCTYWPYQARGTGICYKTRPGSSPTGVERIDSGRDGRSSRVNTGAENLTQLCVESQEDEGIVPARIDGRCSEFVQQCLLARAFSARHHIRRACHICTIYWL